MNGMECFEKDINDLLEYNPLAKAEEPIINDENWYLQRVFLNNEYDTTIDYQLQIHNAQDLVKVPYSLYW